MILIQTDMQYKKVWVEWNTIDNNKLQLPAHKSDGTENLETSDFCLAWESVDWNAGFGKDCINFLQLDKNRESAFEHLPPFFLTNS